MRGGGIFKKEEACFWLPDNRQNTKDEPHSASRKGSHPPGSYLNLSLNPIFSIYGGEGGIRTHGPRLSEQPISSRPRYDHFGTSPLSFVFCRLPPLSTMPLRGRGWDVLARFALDTMRCRASLTPPPPPSAGSPNPRSAVKRTADFESAPL